MIGRFAVFVILLTLISIYSIKYHVDPKRCYGQYIIPNYKKIEINSTNKLLSEKYQLFRHSFSDGYPEGLPLLFIPGSAGSFNQIRSFSSISRRVLKHYKFKKPLDMYVGIFALT